ncbi:cytochrome c oxidase subunit II [Bacillus sp. CGMCC 1.16607]|uniref:cytochrome c oxidase subunit II n=1 Tax=Bacillus sp. CGMCC 1.16607 TaxID=3351842 RepID=UPI00363F5EA4
MYQQIAWSVTLFLVFLIALAFAFVYGESRRLKDYVQIQKKGYKIRKYYFLGLLAIMAIMSGVTLTRLPYDHHGTAAENFKTVDVKGIQFAWELSDEEFIVGEPIEFRVTSKDVTHGFGLYDENMQLIAQTQAMPEYTNSVYHTFEKPGKYKILCMEYCSVGHHIMVKEIIVKNAKGGNE